MRKTLTEFIPILFIILFSSSKLFAQWVQTNGLQGMLINCFAVNGNYIYTGTNYGFYFSTDNGLNWESATNDGLTQSNVNALLVIGDKIYEGNNGLFVSTNNGNNWQEVNSSIGGVESFITYENNIFIASLTGIYRSTDNGTEWTVANTGLTNYNIVSFAAIDSILFAGAIYDWFPTYGYVFRSSNKGDTWIRSDSSSSPSILEVYSLAVKGKNIFAVSDLGIYISTDNGIIWTLMNNDLPANYECRELIVNGINLFASIAGSGIVYLSTNDGLNWLKINEGLPQGSHVRILWVHGDYLYLGTDGYGVWRRPLSDFATLPVEITSFTLSTKSNNITLNWKTATELNTSKFEIERKSSASAWNKIGEITATGNSTAQKNYSYTDSKLAAGKYYYRLKMVDLDGTFKYSNEIQVDISLPKEFSLSQNYPNPFNPNTVINYSLPKDGNVKLIVYNAIGSNVATIVDEYKSAGSYSVQFTRSNLASGIYMYRLEASNYSATKKLIILK